MGKTKETNEPKKELLEQSAEENPNQAKLDSEAEWLAECMLSNLAHRYREPSKIIAARAAARVLGNGGAVTVLNAHSCFAGETDEPKKENPPVEIRDSKRPELSNQAQPDFRDALEKASDDFLAGLRALHEEYLRQRDREKYYREKAEKWEKQAEAWRRRCYRSSCNTCDAYAEKEELRLEVGEACDLLGPDDDRPLREKIESLLVERERLRVWLKDVRAQLAELRGFPEKAPQWMELDRAAQENVSRETSRREQESIWWEECRRLATCAIREHGPLERFAVDDWGNDHGPCFSDDVILALVARGDLYIDSSGRAALANKEKEK